MVTSSLTLTQRYRSGDFQYSFIGGMLSVWRVVEMKFRAALFDLGGTLIRTSEVPQIFKRILVDLRFDRSIVFLIHRWSAKVRAVQAK